jgi:hypothetical protein
MRTFHIGGAAQKGAERSQVEANMDAEGLKSVTVTSLKTLTAYRHYGS